MNCNGWVNLPLAGQNHTTLRAPWHRHPLVRVLSRAVVQRVIPCPVLLWHCVRYLESGFLACAT